MTDNRLSETIATLEQARTELESALRADPHWRALGRATLPANRAAHERALADNPVHQAWKLVVRAIGEMRALSAAGGGAGRDGAAPEAAPPQAPGLRTRVELRHVLERIRGEAALDGGEPPAAGPAATELAAADGPRAAPATRATAAVDIDIEEATVSFVVLEPAAPGPQPAPPAEPAVEPQRVGDGVGVAAAASGAAPASGEEGGSETEVKIVSRRR
jgi:hypothetical protein